MPKIPVEYMYVWYILRYHKDFNGKLSDEGCMKKIANETGGVNLVQFVFRKNELKKFSAEEMSMLKIILEEYGLYVD